MQIDTIDKLSMRNTTKTTYDKILAWLSKSPVESPSYHNGFPLDLDDHKIKWSHHRSFLYRCDRSPGMHVLKLGTEIPNLKQRNWSTELIWKF